MPNMVLKVSRWYQRLLLSYRENTGGDNAYLTPRVAWDKNGPADCDLVYCAARDQVAMHIPWIMGDVRLHVRTFPSAVYPSV